MKTICLFLFLVATMLCASATPVETEAHWIATMQKDYREAALVVLADTSSNEHNVIIDVLEVWKAAPGYTAGRILIPKEPGTAGTPGMKRSIVYFPLKGTVTQWGWFRIENERALLAPSYTLAQLKQLLVGTVAEPIQPPKPTTSAVH